MSDDIPTLGDGAETRYFSNGWIEICSAANRDEEWIATDSPVEIQQ